MQVHTRQLQRIMEAPAVASGGMIMVIRCVPPIWFDIAAPCCPGSAGSDVSAVLKIAWALAQHLLYVSLALQRALTAHDDPK